jgi:branched-chain amino acid transport system ATP-binding protein
VSLLEVERVVKDFGGVRALDGVDLALEPGQVVGLIGPNGAGKTTLFNVISGFLAPTAGRVRFGGADLLGLRPDQVCHRGIARTFQIAQPFARMTVAENVATACLFGRRAAASASRITRRAAMGQARELLAYGKLADVADRPAAALTLSQRKRLEMVRALATGPELLLLDEVMAGLNPQETDEMAAIIRQVRQQLGLAILLIEHNLRAVMSLSETMLVLNYGTVIARGAPDAIAADEVVIRAYLGESRRRHAHA